MSLTSSVNHVFPATGIQLNRKRLGGLCAWLELVLYERITHYTDRYVMLYNFTSWSLIEKKAWFLLENSGCAYHIYLLCNIICKEHIAIT